MPDRLVELLLKAVRQLPQDEQDEVLGVLLGGLAPPGGAAALSTTLGSSQVGLPAINAWHVGIPAVPAANLGVGAGQPLGVLESLGAKVPGEADTALKVLPVRLPVADYERLRAFSREHGFSMAVIIRTLVERFLDERAAQPGDDATA